MYSKEHKCHNDMNNAIRAGKLIRSVICSNCGSGGKIEGHHEDYDKPFDVVWLCIRCHNDLHMEGAS